MAHVFGDSALSGAARVDLSGLTRRFSGLQVRLSSIEGQTKEMLRQQKELSDRLATTKARIELAPQASAVFEFLQQRAHARAVGEFEDLLTAFVTDVVPHAGKIHLEITTERGASGLEILIDNGGELEDVFEANGGGMSNVVGTAIAFSALSRTTNRQFIVLDEPDCWLKSTYVPAFTRLISQVASPAVQDDGSVSGGIQTLMISHNSVDLMDEGAHLQELRLEMDPQAYADRMGLKLVREGTPGDCGYVRWAPGVDKELARWPNGRLIVEYVDSPAMDPDNNQLTKGLPVIESISGAKPFSPEQTGIRWIEVRNLRYHAFTRLELSAGLNVLAGDINSGKSTLYLTALRALAYGQTDDHMIRHGASEAVIRVGLEGGVELEVVRVRKGSPKVLFRRYENGVLVNEGRPESRGAVPSFITEVLGIAKVDDLDMQLRSQKEPVFLLNEPSPRRARLLSVGRETGLLSELIDRQRQTLRKDREAVRRDEADLARTNRLLQATAPLGSLQGLVPLMAALLEQSRELEVEIAALGEQTTRLAPLAKKQRIVESDSAQKLAGALPDLPEVFDVKALMHAAQSVERSGKLVALHPRFATLDLPEAPDVAALHEQKDVARDVVELHEVTERARLHVAAHTLTELPQVPQLYDTASLRTQGVAVRKSAEAVSMLEKDGVAVKHETAQAQTELQAARDSIGVCPVCETPMNTREHVHA